MIKNKISCDINEIIRQTKAIIKNIINIESKIISIKDISNPRDIFERLSRIAYISINRGMSGFVSLM
jgi:hypothetical protein